MYSDYKLVQKCLKQIEDSLGWGDSQSWHNDVFSELSERVQQKTKVLLSPVTLKRVWGRIEYQSAPSKTTLNTLAQFAGYANWRDFKGNSISKKKPNAFKKIATANLGVIMLSASVMTVIFISFFSLKGSNDNTQIIDPDQILFSSKPLAKGMPNSVVFELDLDNITSDSIHIQQYWDPTKTIALTKGQTQATGQYYRPGYFRAKLLVDGKAIKQHDLFIKSEGWLGTVDYQPIPKYLNSNQVYNGSLAMPNEIIKELDQSDEPLRTSFHFVDDLEHISGDNFKLNATLQNSYREKWAVCQNTGIVILGTKGAHFVSFSIPGCVSDLGVMMNDVYKNGKEHNLSGLGIDFTEPKEIEIRVEDKNLTVSQNGETMFTGSYNETVGRLVGIRFRFLGAGNVHQFKITDLEGQNEILAIPNQLIN